MKNNGSLHISLLIILSDRYNNNGDIYHCILSNVKLYVSQRKSIFHKIQRKKCDWVKIKKLKLWILNFGWKIDLVKKKQQKKNIKIFWLKHKFWIQKTHKINLFQNIFAQKKKKRKGVHKKFRQWIFKKRKKKFFRASMFNLSVFLVA